MSTFVRKLLSPSKVALYSAIYSTFIILNKKHVLSNNLEKMENYLPILKSYCLVLSMISVGVLVNILGLFGVICALSQVNSPDILGFLHLACMERARTSQGAEKGAIPESLRSCVSGHRNYFLLLLLRSSNFTRFLT